MIHSVNDQDTHFIIDGASRSVKNETETKSMLVQYDHNSERFTFRVPRTVDDHDLSLCNTVRVHYINIDKSKRVENKGVCSITETLEVCPDDDKFAQCSWLIPDEATQLAGSLHFVVQFACMDGDNIVYSWNTAKHTGVQIADGINGGKEMIGERIDILRQWENNLIANQIMKVEQTQESFTDNGENIVTITFGDGRTESFTIRNGSRGKTGLVGSIETVAGSPLHFFVGTKAEYDALTDKSNLFAIITDDNAKADLEDSIQELYFLAEGNIASINEMRTEVYCGTVAPGGDPDFGACVMELKRGCTYMVASCVDLAFAGSTRECAMLYVPKETNATTIVSSKTVSGCYFIAYYLPQDYNGWVLRCYDSSGEQVRGYNVSIRTI